MIAPIIMQGRHVAPGQEGGREREREREREQRERNKSRWDGLSRRDEKRKYSEMDRWRKSELLKQEGKKSGSTIMSTNTVSFSRLMDGSKIS